MVSRVSIQDIALKLCITQNKHGMLSPAHEYTSSQTLHTFKVCGGLPTRIAIANHRRNVVNMQDSNGTMGICKHIELHRRGLAKFEGSIALDYFTSKHKFHRKFWLWFVGFSRILSQILTSGELHGFALFVVVCLVVIAMEEHRHGNTWTTSRRGNSLKSR